MRNYKINIYFIVIVFALAFNVFADENSFPSIQEVNLHNRINSSTITVSSDQIIDYELYELANPPRIIIDPMGRILYTLDTVISPTEQGIVRNIKAISSRSGDLDLLSIELIRTEKYSVFTIDHTIVVEIGEKRLLLDAVDTVRDTVSDTVVEDIPVVMVTEEEEEKITDVVIAAQQEIIRQTEAQDKLAQQYDELKKRQQEAAKRQYQALRAQQQKLIDQFNERQQAQTQQLAAKKEKAVSAISAEQQKLEQEKAKIAIERKKIEQEKARLLEEKKLMLVQEEEKLKLADEDRRKLLEQEKIKLAEAEKKQDEEVKLREEQEKARLTEEARLRGQAEEQERQRIVEEANRRAEEEKDQLAEERQRLEQERQRLAEHRRKEHEKASQIVEAPTSLKLSEAPKPPKAPKSPEMPKVPAPVKITEPPKPLISLEELEGDVLKFTAPEDGATLDEAQQIAYRNYQPLETAKEELDLSKKRVFEAKRALYPQLTAKATLEEGSEIDTTGGNTASAIEYNFESQSYGVQIEQPLFYSGRLRNTLKKAETEAKIADIKHDNIKNQLSFEVARSYYDLVASQRNLALQMDLLKHAKDLLDLSTRRHEKGLLTDLEYLKVQSSYNQISFQVDSGTKDIALARLKFYQTLGIDQEPDTEKMLPSLELSFEEKEVKFDELRELALRQRPDLRINKLLVESNEYEKKIAKGKNSLKVDLTGFLGQSGSAYAHESVEYGNDWYIGFKASVPWGGSTAGYTFAQNETAPRLGRETRTGGTSHSVELSVLNNLGALNEVKEAEINLLKAQDELNENRKLVEAEVKGAYIDYQKSIIQVANTIGKIKFREEEVKIYHKKTQLNQMPVSELMDAMIKLADEKALYNEALADFHLALAKLNKAVGGEL